MTDRYYSRVPLPTSAAPAVMPPPSDRQGAVVSPADRRPIGHQTNFARAAPAEITATSDGFREHPTDMRGAIREPSRFPPPARGATMFRPKSPVPEPECQGDELADPVPFGLGATEEGTNDEETLAPGEPVLFPDKIAKRETRSRRLGLFIGGVLGVAVAAGVTYVMLQGKSSIAPPLVAAAVSSPKVMMLTYKGDQNMPSNESVDGTQTGSIGKKASAASDDAAALGAHLAVDLAPPSDADADQVSAGKPPPGASPALAAVAPAEPGGVPASASGDAAPVSDDGAAAGGNASAASAAAARGQTPLAKPADKAAVLAASGGSINLTEAKAGKPAPGSPVAPSGRVFVQVSAQKSETAARSAYRGLQVKFPTILGKLDPNIQRADLGDKGVFYRVRVGPFALADAQEICGSYKAVGGSDCLIARH